MGLIINTDVNRIISELKDIQMLLSWNDFAINSANTFRQLWNDQDFTDVTLVTEDEQHIRAHKMILSSSSAFFRNLLMGKTHQNLSIIYLKGIRHNELEMVLKFIYFGECHVAENELQDFLSTGKELKVDGLVNETALEPKYQNMWVKPEMAEIFSNDKEPALKQTGKFDCLPCDKTYTSLKGHLIHIQSVHEGKTYGCDQCDYKSSTENNLKRHQQSKHEGTSFKCEKCDYEATNPNSLKAHQQAIHDGVRFQCDQCDYTATQQQNLKSHKGGKHKMNIFVCDQCSFTTGWKNHFYKHKKTVHISKVDKE